MRTDDLDSLECQECSETFTPAEAVEKAKATLPRWERFAVWLAEAPVV
jgi:hypothetical protein